MHHWGSQGGEKLVHVFYKNNEIAGYAAVLHCLQLVGIDGHYGPTRRVVILSYGSVSRGAIYAFHGLGSRRSTSIRGDRLISSPIRIPTPATANISRARTARSWSGTPRARSSLSSMPWPGADVICNGILQDTNRPVMFVRDDEVERLKPRSVIIDISCDEGMGFPFARPTTFKDPVFLIGDRITYYSVDHTPSYLWSAASSEISTALLPYLRIVQAGAEAWEAEPTIARAVDILDGVVRNPNILNFQKRKKEYPHGPILGLRRRLDETSPARPPANFPVVARPVSL